MGFYLLAALDDHPNHEKLLEKKIKILCHQGLFDDAYNLALQWLQREPRVSEVFVWLITSVILPYPKFKIFNAPIFQHCTMLYYHF